MKLHIVRHGATKTSGQSYAGRRDVALTEAGRAEAVAVADALEDRPIGLILASPLSRAIETARPLADRLGLPVLAEPALVEFDFGAYEGRSKAEIGLVLRKTHLVDPVPGGESLRDVWLRTGEVLARIRRDFRERQDRDIVCVGHFWINRLLHGRYRGLDFDTACRERGFRPRTGEIRTV